MNNAVAYRSRAVVSPEMVNAVGHRASRVGHLTGETRTVTQQLTHLVARAWVRNTAYTKSVWVDVHVFDQAGEVISSGTYPLRYSHSPDDGDIFEFDAVVHWGGAVGGPVGFAQDAWRVQYRLYYEVNGQVYTDNILHQHDVHMDEATRNECASGQN